MSETRDQNLPIQLMSFYQDTSTNNNLSNKKTPSQKLKLKRLEKIIQAFQYLRHVIFGILFYVHKGD